MYWVSLNFDLPFEISLGEAGWHLNDLGNSRVTTYSNCDVGSFCAGPLDRAADGLTYGLGINNCLFTDRAWRCWLRGIGLDPKALTRPGKLNQLDRRRGDIETQQRLRFFFRKTRIFPSRPVSCESIVIWTVAIRFNYISTKC